MLTGLKTVALFAITVCVALAIYCGANGIRSLADFNNFRAMLAVADPVVVAFACGDLQAGSTTQQLLAVDTPQWVESYGRCTIYGFTPAHSYDQQTVVTVDDRVVAARVGSCTWRWTFFDGTPKEVAEAVASARGLRAAIEGMPQLAAVLQPLLDAQFQSLGAPTSAQSQRARRHPTTGKSVAGTAGNG